MVDNTVFGLILLLVIGAFLVSCIWRMYVARDPDRNTTE